jgi:hypothetical protein
MYARTVTLFGLSSGYFLDGGLYAVKDEIGKVVKVATHKLPAIPVDIPDDATEEERKQIILDTAYKYVERLARHNAIAYRTARKPRRLLQAIDSGKEPGEFINYTYKLARTLDAHLTMGIDGRKQWTPLDQEPVEDKDDRSIPLR